MALFGIEMGPIFTAEKKNSSLSVKVLNLKFWTVMVEKKNV